MVFIVKIPGRSRANTPEPATASTPSDQHLSAPPLADIAMDTPPRAAPPTSIPVQPTQDVTAGSLASSSPQVAAQPSPAASVASTAPGAAQLDILLAPAVLNHRYVRGVDKSLIVERPERVRAVLLGIATAIGKSTTDDHPAIPSLPSTYPAAAPGPAVSDDDDLVARLGSLSMQAKPDARNSSTRRPDFGCSIRHHRCPSTRPTRQWRTPMPTQTSSSPSSSPPTTSRNSDAETPTPLRSSMKHARIRQRPHSPSQNKPPRWPHRSRRHTPPTSSSSAAELPTIRRSRKQAPPLFALKAPARR